MYIKTLSLILMLGLIFGAQSVMADDDDGQSQDGYGVSSSDDGCKQNPNTCKKLQTA